jgi:PTH1 family peptidyl-tRNA hydrolase
MKLIVGLGNPGKKYELNRHNIGFLILDGIAHDKNEEFKFFKNSLKSLVIQTEIENEKVILLKPQTFMNLSGDSVLEVAHFFKILPEDILVIHDDLDLPFNVIRLKFSGGDGGHNGLKSITKSLGTQNYYRIRVGIGRPENKLIDISDYVLSDFSKEEEQNLNEITDKAFQAISSFCKGKKEFLNLMNTMNQKIKEKN